MLKQGTQVRVRENTPDSLFGPVYDCTIAAYHPEIGITVKYGDHKIICVDMQKHDLALCKKVMHYIVTHAETGSIISMGTIRQMQIDAATKALENSPYGKSHIEESLSASQGNDLKCAFSETP